MARQAPAESTNPLRLNQVLREVVRQVRAFYRREMVTISRRQTFFQRSGAGECQGGALYLVHHDAH